MKKKIFKSLVALFLLGSTLSVASCGGKRNDPTTGGDHPQTTTAPTSNEEKSVIKSLTALSESFESRNRFVC